MEEGYINTGRKKGWEPEAEQQKNDTHEQARQEYNKEEEKALDLLEAYPKEMLLLMERADK